MEFLKICNRIYVLILGMSLTFLCPKVRDRKKHLVRVSLILILFDFLSLSP